MRQVKLFTPFTIKNVTLKNRIVMSPMCMYSCLDQNGKVTNWHRLHYPARAVGQVGLVMLESTAISPEGRIGREDLGIWNDEHVEGLTELTQLVHEQGAKVGIQIGHAGRKSEVDGTIIGPSAIAFDENSRVPEEMTTQDIDRIVQAFRAAARRAKEAGFDIIEIHAAHGYLIHEFLSPVSNLRTDHYGGSLENRYRFLEKIIEAVKQEWAGPIFVRISATDYVETGNSIETNVIYAQKMKHQGVDLIDCSTGAIVPAKIKQFPGYQVSYADQIRKEANIATGAVGLITKGDHAEEIVQNNRADLVFIGRELLYNPYWALKVAAELHCDIDIPRQYMRDKIGGRVKRW